jgi:hypothetical protein
MKAYPIIIGALVLILVLLGNYAIDLYSANKRKNTVISEKDDTIRHYINENGRVVAEKTAALITAKELSQAYPLIAAELKNDFDIKLKNLRAYMQSQFAAQGSGNATITNNYHIDSLGRKVHFKDFDVSDGYLTFHSVLYDSLVTAPYKYLYQDTISTAINVKKKWLFGNEKLYSSSMLKNPNAKVTGTTNILIDTHKDKRWYIGIGASYNPINNTIGPSVNVGYTLIKF